MRVLIVLKTKKFAVADSQVFYSDTGYDTFELATGGQINVTKENVDYIIQYDDRHIDWFRSKLEQLRTNNEYEAI